MKHSLLMAIFVFSIFLPGKIVLADDEPVSTEEKQEKKSKDDGRSMIGMTDQCQELSEKLEMIKPIQATVNNDFKRVKDKKLCTAMSLQCEYFYSLVKSTAKEYKSECDTDVELSSLEKCDYSDNDCPHVLTRSTSPSVQPNFHRSARL